MQAVILAGGRGTRLGALTERIPKPLAPVVGKPYLSYQLEYLARQGWRDVLLLTGYLGEQVEAYVGDGARWGLRVDYSREPHPLGTGGALRLAAPRLQEKFLLIYGDSFLPIVYAEVMARLEESGAPACVVVYDNRQGDTAVQNNIALRGDGWVACYRKGGGGEQELTHVEAGVLALRREVVSLVPEGVASLEMEVFPKLAARGQLAAFVTRQRFYDIGTPERLAAFEEYLRT